jgi:hypothetical protein
MESIRSRQTGIKHISFSNFFWVSVALKQILNLNQPLNPSLATEPIWKLLIFDNYGQDIISPILNIKQLREMGVTLHMFVSYGFFVNLCILILI